MHFINNTFCCWRLVLLTVGSLWAAVLSAQAQQFGQNKIGYKTFEFKVMQSRNFELYHYLKNEPVRDYWARQSEKWYQTHKQVLGDTIPFRNPIIFYANHADFQQTNVTPGPIDPATGGFAEALKNRIVMPVMKANAQTDHVLGHEIAHAMQFQMIRDVPNASVSGLFQLPLWFVEGMAEYLSIGPVDAHTALWMRDAVQRNDLPTLTALTNDPSRYFPYRWGHALWAYVTGTWGERAIRPLYLTAVQEGYEAAIQKVLGLTPAELAQQWHAALRSHYVPSPSMPALAPLMNRSGAGQPLARMQLSPALSPDGRLVAMVSEKSGVSFDVWLADAQTGRVRRRLLSTTRHAHLDALSYLESAGTWSPDSRQFAFVAFADGVNKLIIIDVRTGRIRQTLALPGVPAFSNPTWSPRGNQLVVNGLVDGQPDLFLYDFEGKTVRQLTNDRFSELQPSWSPDGRTLVYATDLPAKADDRPLAFDHRLALYDLPTERTRILDVFAGADNLNPVFGVDNQTVYFLSDRDGYRNLYAHNPYDGRVYQLTRFNTGITGLTPHAPALSAARETGHLAFTVFEGGGYRLYRADPTDLLWERVTPNPNAQPDRPMAILPPFPRFNQDFVAARLNATRPADPTLTGPLEAKPFRDKFRLVDISSGGGVGVTTTNRLGTSLNGGVNVAFGNMLNDRQFGAGLAVAGEITDISGQLTYLNKRRRVNWGVALSHLPFRSGSQRVGAGAVEVEGETVPVQILRTDLQRTFEQQASLLAYLPFSRTRRLEMNLSAARYSFRIDRTDEFFFRGRRIGSEQGRAPSPADVFTGQVGAAWVGDNTTMGPVGPLKGHRFRLGAESTFGPVQLQTLTADFRQYYRMRPLTLAFRGMHIARLGRDANAGFLPPLFVGFPTLVRGYSAESYLTNPERGPDDLSIGQLQGTRMAVANAELRLSLMGAERQSLFRSRVVPIELALFTDAGMAWGRSRPQSPIVLPTSPNEVNRIAYSSGVSVRANLLGFIVLEPFYALPWARTGTNNGLLGFNIAAAW